MEMDSMGPERVVVYSTTPAANAPGAYGGGQYYNNIGVGGNAWVATQMSITQGLTRMYLELILSSTLAATEKANHRLATDSMPMAITILDRLTAQTPQRRSKESRYDRFNSALTCDDR